MKCLPCDAESIAGINAHLKHRTSRVIVPQPHADDPAYYADRYNHSDEWAFWLPDGRMSEPRTWQPPYSVGDVVAVTETWATERGLDCFPPSECTGIGAPIYYKVHDIAGEGRVQRGRWRPARFMPADFARFHAIITSIDVGRIQSMTYDEIVAEGWPGLSPTSDEPNMEERSLARKWWTARWDGINAKRGYPYSMNPWAYGYGFEVVEVKR